MLYEKVGATLGEYLRDHGAYEKSFPSGNLVVKNLPAMQETWVQSPCWEDPLEKGKASHSSIVAWRFPSHGGAWQATVHIPWGHKDVDMTK